MRYARRGDSQTAVNLTLCIWDGIVGQQVCCGGLTLCLKIRPGPEW